MKLTPEAIRAGCLYIAYCLAVILLIKKIGGGKKDACNNKESQGRVSN